MPAISYSTDTRHLPLLAAATALTLSFAVVTTAGAQGAVHGAVGLGVATAPKYAGAQDYRTLPFPFLQVEYRDRAFAGVLPSGLGFGVGAHVHKGEAIGVQVALSQANARKEHYGDALAGMGDQTARATAGLGLTLRHGIVSLSAHVAHGLDAEVGTVGDVSLAASRAFGTRWVASVSTGATAADRRNMEFEFGITDAQAATRQALIDDGDARLRAGDGAAFAPSAGLKQLQASASLAYATSARTRLMVFAQGARLSDEAAGSSLVRARDGASGGMALVYGF